MPVFLDNFFKTLNFYFRVLASFSKKNFSEKSIQMVSSISGVMSLKIRPPWMDSTTQVYDTTSFLVAFNIPKQYLQLWTPVMCIDSNIKLHFDRYRIEYPICSLYMYCLSTFSFFYHFYCVTKLNILFSNLYTFVQHKYLDSRYLYCIYIPKYFEIQSSMQIPTFQ